MRPPAHVTSIDLLRDFRAGLIAFHADAGDALTAITLDLRRSFDWLTERKTFWTRKIREFQDEITHAKADLTRRQLVPSGDRVPDCTQQLKALRLAQARLAHAEEQVDRCRRWVPLLQRAVEEYEGPTRQFAAVVENELPKAISRLERTLDALMAYLAVKEKPLGGSPAETPVAPTSPEPLPPGAP